MRIVLRVLAGIYGWVTSLRNTLYEKGWLRSYRSRLPVVSVGNVTAGGNGKTPLVMYLVQELQARGRRPVILSRGYGGAMAGPHRVTSTDSAFDVGDEPLLMARTSGVPVYISRARVAGAKLIEQEDAGDVIILDDGFQHRKLQRDVDIVSIFAGTEQSIRDFSDGHILPLGMFREARNRALKRASLVVVSYRSVLGTSEEKVPVDDRILATIPSGTPVFRSFYEFVDVRNMATDEVVAPMPVHVVAGIANPEGFFTSVERAGYTVLQKHAYADHHAFTEPELLGLIEKHPGVAMVCTEKDAVKIKEMSPRIVSSFGVFRVRPRVVPSDAFIVAVDRAISAGLQRSLR
jgi:tetraacyldisaccharide 4'-kinase